MKNNRLLSLICSFAFFPFCFLFFSPLKDASAFVLENEYRSSNELIPHAFIIYLSPKGQSFFKRGLENLLYNNGINFEQFEKKDFTFSTGEKPLSELLPQKDISELISQVKNFLNSSLVGMSFSEFHNFSLKIENIYFESLTENLGVEFYVPQDSSSSLSFKVSVSIKSLLLDLNSVVLKDHLHEFLGDYGVSQFQLYFDEQDGPLELNFYLDLSSDGDNLHVSVKSLDSNIDDLNLKIDYTRPLILPEFSITIGDSKASLNRDNLEHFISEYEEVILLKMKDLFKNEALSSLPLAEDFINRILKNFTSNPHLNDLVPPASPEDSPVYKWGLLFSDLGPQASDLKVTFDAFLQDPYLGPDVPFSLEYYYKNNFAKKDLDLDPLLTKDYDLTLAINQGFFNRLFYHNFRRGYFDKMKMASKELSLGAPPVINLANCAQLGPPMQTICYPYLDVVVAYPLTSTQAVAFNKNSFVASARLYFDFNVDGSNVSITIKNFDPKSVLYDVTQIKFGLGWLVEPFLKDILQDLSDKLKNFTLLDALPLPTSMWGLGFEIKNIVANKDGYLMVSIDFKHGE